jgi:hypothetical protein
MSTEQPNERWTFLQWCEGVGFYDPSASIAAHYRSFTELVQALPQRFMLQISEDKFGRWWNGTGKINRRDEALCVIGVLHRVAQQHERLILNGVYFADHARIFLRSTTVCEQPFAELSAEEIDQLLARPSQDAPSSQDILRQKLYRRVFPSPYTPIIGRDREIDDLLNRLGDRNSPIVCVVGTAGDGKTNLTWHTVCRAVDSGLFSAFDWVTDRSMYVDSNGDPRPTDLPALRPDAIFNSMINNFDWADLKLIARDVAERCAKKFREGHYCLVLDNMETTAQLERFLRELSILVQPTPPRTSRILITSRVESSAPFVSHMPLKGLEREAAIAYVKHMETRYANVALSDSDREQLAEITGGNPLFIQIALARYVRNGRNIRLIVDQVRQSNSFFSTFQNLFGGLYESLSPAAKQVALDAAQYTEEITREDLEADAEYYMSDSEQFERALMELVSQQVLKPSDVAGYYTIHPLVRAYLTHMTERNDRLRA